jgi:nitronate monooxygenase
MTKLPPLIIGDMTVELPIIQGGMGVSVSKASLAGAVSAEGGLGVIASVGLGEDEAESKSYRDRSCDSLRSEVRAVKERGLPVGVNIMVALTNYRDMVEVCVEEQVEMVISGAGLPLHLPEFAGDTGMKLVPIVSSARAAEILFKAWLRKSERLPDALVVEGPLAGGHLGFKFDEVVEGTADNLETLVTQVLGVVQGYEKQHDKKIPVIAAGGVFTGEDIAKFIKLGAGGVQMGTRFVATHECDTSDEYKQAFVDATEEDVVVIHSPVGLPARVLKNGFVKRSMQGEKFKFACPYKCLLTCEAKTANYCIASALLNASRGKFDDGFAMCGENVYKIDKIVSVKELMQELVSEAEQHLA